MIYAKLKPPITPIRTRAMRATIDNATGLLIEAGDSTTETLIANAVAMGYARAAFTVKEVTRAELRALLDAVNANVVPAEIELWKARVVMKSTPWAGTFGGTGKTVFDAAQAAVAAMTDQAKKRAALEAMDYTNFLTRDGSIVKMIQRALGMTDAQCDALFVQAAAIQS